ncbi:hypothetical protein C488_05257 [Natrinema pellirubrum DSM 15624]|uniref:Uncharacterized protein n=1 Tax=Natrinema pellirubrum (strain DSM 15624 / CIP 106293 / JCM 10476 / NCIMB 786 / 157) TaxID=797303 RepID=L9Z0M2_NATP1|nr:hypothetical protein C488_05257 [Natrinema pellirubrum DSM 15624]
MEKRRRGAGFGLVAVDVDRRPVVGRGQIAVGRLRPGEVLVGGVGGVSLVGARVRRQIDVRLRPSISTSQSIAG